MWGWEKVRWHGGSASSITSLLLLAAGGGASKPPSSLLSTCPSRARESGSQFAGCLSDLAVPVKLPSEAVVELKVHSSPVSVIPIAMSNCRSVPSSDDNKEKPMSEYELLMLIAKILSTRKINYVFAIPRGVTVVDNLPFILGCEMPRYAPRRGCDECCSGALSLNCPAHMGKCGREIFLNCLNCPRILCYDHRDCFCDLILAEVHSAQEELSQRGKHASSGRSL